MISLAGSALFNIILWLLLLSKFGSGSDAIALHYSVVSGIDLVAAANKAYQLPAAGAAVLILNLFLSRLFYDREQIFSYFLSWGTLLVQLFLGLAVVSLMFLNA